MIINYPTALYASVIPSTASNSGDTTFTISMTSPPSNTLSEIQLPAYTELRKRLAINQTPPSGQRVYTNTMSSAAIIGSAKKQFEVGQILEFDTAEESTIKSMLVSNSLEVRHDTNILDLSSLGVSEADITIINNSALVQFTNLNTKLNAIRQSRIDTETDISENQKSQNETKKAITALEQLVISDSSLQSILDSLRTKLAEFVVQMDVLVIMANEQATDASEIENQIFAVAQMVR
jgi:hypothetical protein